MKRRMKSNPLYKTIPTDISEMSLKQLVGLSLYWHICYLGGKIDMNKIANGVSMFCDIDREEAANLNVEDMVKVKESAEKAFVSCKKFYDLAIESKGAAVSFKAIPDRTELFYLETELEMCSKWKFLKRISLYRQVRKARKEVAYHPDKKFDQIPAMIWTDFIDNISSKVKSYDELFWLEWKEIPRLLPLFCWREGEPKLIKVGNRYTIDKERQERLKQSFLHIPAKDAMSIFCFFLCNRIGYSQDQNLRRCLNLYETVRMRLSSQESSSTEGGVGLITSED